MAYGEEYIIYNGELQSQQLTPQVYIYQDIHTLGHKPRHIAQHLRIIDHAADKLFGIRCHISIKDLEQQVTELLAANLTTRNTSVCVRLELYSSGDYSIRQKEVSIYKGYVMCSLRYEATFISSHMPLGKFPSSAMAATRELMLQIAQARELHYLIPTSPDGQIVIDSSEPLMIIKNRTLYAPKLATPSVEQQITERAASRLGLHIEHTTLNVEQIKDADEVFTINWQGIRSIAHINQRPYMAILTEQLALEMENEHK